MKTPIIERCPYHHNSLTIFRTLYDLPYAIWLDSCHNANTSGRFDIICAAPSKMIAFAENKTIISQRNDDSRDCKEENYTEISCISEQDPFALLKAILYEAGFPNYRQPRDLEEYPFIGGLLGLFGYDLGHRIQPNHQYRNNTPAGPVDTIGATPHSLSGKANGYSTPDLLVGLYDWVVIQDHCRKQCVLIRYPNTCPRLMTRIKSMLNQCHHNPTSTEQPSAPFQLTSTFTSNLSQLDYVDRLNQVQRYIRAGDVYQVNFAQRFRANYTGDPLSAYSHLRDTMPAPYAAYFKMSNGNRLMSFSPEQLLCIEKNNRVTTKPIKGTRPRHLDQQQDQLAINALRHSQKDKAENLMIVDLLRNDLGKCCLPGSISVPTLFGIESFANVHHLVSTVQGMLDTTRYSALDLLRACFPGGSVTGAPKLRAMQIIDELEPDGRSVYCGSIGYISLDGKMNSNITIRTLLCEQNDDGNHIYCWGGGGIVVDSDAMAEYQETFDKVGILMNALKSNG